ncbi:MAG: patatin family protein [Lachnospiraceae bacterium]|jgi:predicted patatin/cPLA2 family phospholipase|nr:patatin family protein [Lachnospiraceae bacterium]
MRRAGMILEGGGTRGVFTAGVLDYFMEQGLYLPYVIGVSAGACNAVNYVSHQKGRMKTCTIDFLEAGSYVGFRSLVKNHSLFNMDLIFDIFPNKIIPFDYEAFFSSGQTCILTATNCLTGKAAYLTERGSRERLMKACRASASLPIVSPMVEVDKVPMLDGGVADSVPIRKALHDGVKKNIVILTRQEGYRKAPAKRSLRMARILYQKYPYLIRAIKNRAYFYNRTMELLEDLEERGRVLVIRPQVPVVKNTEDNVRVLTDFYNHGYEYAKDTFSQVTNYLGWEP